MWIDLLQVAIAAQQVAVKRIASLVRLVGELHVARFAHVTVDVEVLIHRHHANCFFRVGVGILHRCDAWKITRLDSKRLIRIKQITLFASSALRREQMMIIVDAINLVVNINREGNTIEAFIADTTAETSGVIRLAHRVKNLKIVEI